MGIAGVLPAAARPSAARRLFSRLRDESGFIVQTAWN